MPSNWIMEEYERANKRWAQLPVWARPVVIRPITKPKPLPPVAKTSII